MTDILNKFEKFCREENYIKIKEYLIKYKSLANANNGEYFEIIADKGNLDIIKLFVENGANINIDNNYILYTCAYNKYYNCLDYLINNGANIENIKYTAGYENAINYLNSKKLI